MLKLTGDTYEIKEFIKDAGGVWDKINKFWQISEGDWEAFKNKKGCERLHRSLIEFNSIEAITLN